MPYCALTLLIAGASIPPNTLEQVPPPLPLPPPLPPPFPFPSFPLPLEVFGEFQAKNLASSSNNLQELFRKVRGGSALIITALPP